MSSPGAVHRELILPNPTGSAGVRTTALPALTIASPHTSWLEVHHDAAGSIHVYLGAPRDAELNHTFHCLREVHAGVHLGSVTDCPIARFKAIPIDLLRATPNERLHYWPMRLLKNADRAGLLVQSLAEDALRGQEVVRQALFRRVPSWESGRFSGNYDSFVATHPDDKRDSRLVSLLHSRKGEPAYHVELRAIVGGPTTHAAARALQAWLRSWCSVRGNPWWDLEAVALKKRERFYDAFRGHDISEFAAKRSRRDISATELAQVLPIPWRDHHPGLTYAGAPSLPAPRELVARPESSGRPTGIVVGETGGVGVQLPADWHHLAILGKTRSGKSTLALHVAGQILAHRPEACVVLLEPTGNLIHGLVERLPNCVAEDAVEIDPAHPTFERDGVEMVVVPLNLLHVPNRTGLSSSEFERRVERISGDLLQSIRNAWGEESIGGRAEFVLRAVLQGLLAVEGTNLVDAYSALSDKKVLQRLERLASGTQLKSALKVHLPKLDYSFTFSSLDKVGKIATNPLLRKALCQRYHPVSFDRLLEHRLLLLNLAKGALGTESSTFLGAIFLTQLWSAIQERPRTDAPIYLVVDEFHNYAIPAFADMLSEGARHGLHVVAITQYLDRIPEKVRSALAGNVDAWAFFAVGAEDGKDVWEIAQGSRFGWKPEHFTGGLRPHQAALALRDTLLKVDTRPAAPPSTSADANRDAVHGSTRRFAAPEDSEASPLALSTLQVSTFLSAFPEEGGLARSELAVALRWPLAQVEASLAVSLASGNVAEGPGRNGVEFGLRARGFFHREALAAARNEGEEHCALLADAAAYLRLLGVHVRIVGQEGGYLRPDAEFGWRGRAYSLEVECSTLVKHHEQVARNLRKALAEGRRCLVVVPDEGMAHLFASVMRRAIPEVELWREVGLLWRESAERMIPYESGRRKPWGFLPGGIDDSDERVPEPEDLDESHAERSVALSAADDPLATDLARTYDRARRLQEQGRSRVTATDFKELTEADNGSSLSLRRLGMALGSLGVRSQRVMRNGVQVREYDLRSLVDRSGFRRAYPGDPSGRDAKDASQES